MTQPPSETNPPDLIVELNLSGTVRWSVYHRLQELGIPCACQLYQPLKVHCRHPLDVIQCWSVVRQSTQSCSALALALETCLTKTLIQQ